MRRNTVVMIALATLVAAGAAAQNDGRGGARVLPGGLAINSAVGAGVLDGRAVGLFELRLTTEAARWLEVGLSGGGVHTLERRYRDDQGRAYQAEFAYAALVARPKLALGEHIGIGLPVSSGTALLQYRYERRYRDDLTWTEEFVDRVVTPTFSLGVDLAVEVTDAITARVEGGYRQATHVASPVAGPDDASGPYGLAGVTFGRR